MADIFISYTSSDRDWAFWLAKELEALAHTPRIHEWEIKGGDDIYAWMQERHDAADHVLCVVSDDYLKAPYSTLERNAALWQATSKRPGFVLFVAVKPCRLPTLSDHIRRCELFGMSEEAARMRFREFMGSRAAPEAVAFPGKVFAVSNIPIRVPTHFMGRDNALVAMERALARYEGRVAITALHGLRGVGKTTLAAAYADRHRGDYRATWWIRAQTEPGMRADLVALGVRLNWTRADDKEEPALAAVMERLRHEGEGILLIFDNAIDANTLNPYLPRGGSAQVLITSNSHAWRGVAEPVEIRLWPKEIGADYLVARTGRDRERAAAEALSEALGGLPLAHEQAAAYCERLDVSLADYRKRFEGAPSRLLDDQRDAPVEYHDGLTVAKTFALAIEEAGKLHPAAEPLIVHAALLAPEPIPLFLFAEGREKFDEPLASALAGEGLDEVGAALRAFALIDRETIVDERDPSIVTDTIRLHRLVREVAAVRREGEPREDVRRALMEALTLVYPGEQEIFENPEIWPRTRRLDAIALALVDAAVPKGAEKQTAELLNGLASYRDWVLAAYVQARPVAERALAIREKILGPEHEDTAESLNKLARLFRVQGEFAQARPLFERALAVREKVLGPEHPDTGESLNNLGVLLRDQGEFAQARPLLERSLMIDEKRMKSNADRVITHNNVAGVLQDLGDLAGARSYFERALAIAETQLGSEHPMTADSLNFLADLLHAQGDLGRARSLCDRALAIRERMRGPDHPDTAMSLDNLARLLEKTGHPTDAEPLFQRAISIAGKALGRYPRGQRYRTNYAPLLLKTGRPAEALALAEPALASLQAACPNHPWTKDTARVTADALDALGRTEEAAALRARDGIEREDHRKE